MAEERAPDHVDDEGLNAALDGEADAAQLDHTDSCARCSARLERLRRVAMAVAAPVEPVADGRRSSMIAVALEARDSATDAARDATDTGDAVAGLPAPMTGHHAGRALTATRRLGRRHDRDRTAGWALAAAGVVVLAVAVPLVGRLQDASDLQQAGRSAGESTADATAETSGPTDPAPLVGGDLGNLDRGDLVAVVDRIARELEQPRSADQTARAEAGAPDQDIAEAPASETAASRCEEMARMRAPALGPLSYVGQARLDGRDAVVLGFSATTDGPASEGSTDVLVLAAEGCTELASAS